MGYLFENASSRYSISCKGGTNLAEPTVTVAELHQKHLPQYIFCTTKQGCGRFTVTVETSVPASPVTIVEIPHILHTTPCAYTTFNARLASVLHRPHFGGGGRGGPASNFAS